MIHKLKLTILVNELKIKESSDYWLILNKLARHKKWEPMTILDKVKEFGMVCFNQFESANHPIDWLYNEYLNLNNA